MRGTYGRKAMQATLLSNGLTNGGQIMNKPKIFLVKYPTGCIRVYVKNFFGESTLTNTNKLLKLAKSYCTEEQRIALLSDLEEARQEQYLSTKRKRIERCIEKIKTQQWGQGRVSC